MRDAAALILLALTSTLLGLALMLSGAVQVSEAIPIADNTWYLTDRGVPAPLYIMIDGHTAGRENVIELRQGSAYAWYSDRNYPYPGGQSMDGGWILYLMVKGNELPRGTTVTFVVGVSQSIGGEIKSYGETKIDGSRLWEGLNKIEIDVRGELPDGWYVALGISIGYGPSPGSLWIVVNERTENSRLYFPGTLVPENLLGFVALAPVIYLLVSRGRKRIGVGG